MPDPLSTPFNTCNRDAFIPERKADGEPLHGAHPPGIMGVAIPTGIWTNPIEGFGGFCYFEVLPKLYCIRKILKLDCKHKNDEKHRFYIHALFRN